MAGKLIRQSSLSRTTSDPSKRIGILANYGSQVEVDSSLGVKLYVRSGREMLRMANMYCDDSQLESAFILYYKFITLFVEKLPKHPSYREAPAGEINEIKKKLKTVFLLAEEIKSKLKKRYIEEEKIFIEEQKRLAEERAAGEERRRQARAEQERQDEELAKKLQEEEEAEVLSEQEKKYRHLKKLEEQKMKEKEKGGFEGPIVGLSAGAAGGGAAAAAIHTDLGVLGDNTTNTVPSSDTQPPESGAEPAPPSYSQYMSDATSYPPQIPDRELKKKLVISDPNGPEASPMPVVDRSKKPVDHHTSLGEFGGQEGQLRTVVVPEELVAKFLAAALSNTAREAETMGILCGKLTQGMFKITNLFVPQQKGGHDSCDMENEEELIYYQDEFNLITLGWIHTHPTQTAFLSSVDLHSHFPWQKMMPEAIAIVCSPKFHETGIFKLTDHGLDVIGSCRQTGFHPHTKDPPLFETCEHVKVVSTESIVLTDKRR